MDPPPALDTAFEADPADVASVISSEIQSNLESLDGISDVVVTLDDRAVISEMANAAQALEGATDRILRAVRRLQPRAE